MVDCFCRAIEPVQSGRPWVDPTCGPRNLSGGRPRGRPHLARAIVGTGWKTEGGRVDPWSTASAAPSDPPKAVDPGSTLPGGPRNLSGGRARGRPRLTRVIVGTGWKTEGGRVDPWSTALPRHQTRPKRSTMGRPYLRPGDPTRSLPERQAKKKPLANQRLLQNSLKKEVITSWLLQQRPWPAQRCLQRPWPNQQQRRQQRRWRRQRRHRQRRPKRQRR